MPISGIPTVTDGDVFAAATWTNMKNAVESKFNAGITGSDFGYPLTLGGSVNLAGFALNRAGQINKAYNLAEGATVQGVFDAVNADGGGAVYVPADTNISMGAITVKGSNVWITGHGPSSVLTVSGTPADWISTSTGTSLITFSNLTFNGGNVNMNMVKLVRTARVRFINCVFQGFGGAAIAISNNGVNGNFSDACLIDSCFFIGSAGSAIFLHDCKNVIISNNYFLDQTGLAAIKALPSGVANFIQNVKISNNYFRPTNTTTVNSVDFACVVGSSAQTDLEIKDNVFDGGSADTQAYVFVNNVSNVVVKGNRFKNCTTLAPAVNIRATSSVVPPCDVSDNEFVNLTGDAIAVGSAGIASGAVDAAETVLKSTFRNNNARNVLRRLLTLNNPDEVIISGNITDSLCGTGMAGARGVVEFWGLAATPTALRINFVNNILHAGTITENFRTSQAGDGGATAAIGSGASLTYTNFSHNYVNGGFATADVVTTAAAAGAGNTTHFNEDNT